MPQNDDPLTSQRLIEKGDVKYATLKDVARLAQTSTATVSYVLNGAQGRYITEELRERVLNASKMLNYRKSLVASGLKQGSRKILTLLVPQFLNVFFAQVINSIEQKTFERGYFLNICNTFDSVQREKEIIEQAISQRVDGFFISGTLEARRNIALIRNYGIPYVVVERPLGGDIDYHFVGSDNIHAGKLAGEHLVKNGHCHFGYIEWMRNMENVRNRRVGFEMAIAPQIEQGGSCIIKSSQALSSENGYRMTEEILRQAKGKHRPTAILYGHHILAEGGIACLRDYELNIPEKVSVIIIGSTEWARLSIPRFTFVCQPIEKIATLASNLLMNLIEKKEETINTGIKKHVCACSLVEGSTVRNLNRD